MSVSTGYENAVVATWIEATLEPDAILNSLGEGGELLVAAGYVPPDVPMPYVVFAWQAPYGDGDSYTADGRLVFSRGLWSVQALAEESGYDITGPIALRVHALLQGANSTPVGSPVVGEIVSCTRRGPIDVADVDQPTGRYFRRLGGMYAIEARSTLTSTP